MDLSQCCQSCGMPMPSDDMYGTNADGSKNKAYCTYCFQNGAFTADVTMAQMVDICIPHMVKGGMDEQTARKIMTETLPQLKRWQ